MALIGFLAKKAKRQSADPLCILWISLNIRHPTFFSNRKVYCRFLNQDSFGCFFGEPNLAHLLHCAGFQTEQIALTFTTNSFPKDFRTGTPWTLTIWTDAVLFLFKPTSLGLLVSTRYTCRPLRIFLCLQGPGGRGGQRG